MLTPISGIRLTFSIVAVTIGAITALPTYANLIITAVYDGPLTGGVPKGVELYVVNDIADLSHYGLGSANNGGGSDGEEFTFPAEAVLAGSFIYVASEVTGFNDFFDFQPDYSTSAMNINGDDAIELFHDGLVVDLFGEVNVDGSGQGWEYSDGWAYRISGSAASTNFNQGDWVYSGANALDNEVDNQTALTPVPIGSYSPLADNDGESPDIVINELDVDTDGTDVLEFIELYDGGEGNTPLAGLVVVLYNGNNDSSYRAFDLDGYATDADGYFVLGNPGVTNVDYNIGASSILQNGADAVAVYEADGSDFPNGTELITDNIVDAVVYGTNDADDLELLVLLNTGQVQINEAGNNGSVLDSNQRCPNGGGGARNTDVYVQASPSPGVANNCPLPATLHLISDIQGNPTTQGVNGLNNDVSPFIGQPVIVEAIVVGDFQNNDAELSRNLGGFFLQEENSDTDGDLSSSEGVFIFDGGFGVDVALGDLVRVSGTVDEYFGETQIGSVTTVEILANNRLADVTPALVSLPTQQLTMSQDGNYQPDLEAYEGMLVSIVETLQISEQFQLDRFNEITLVSGDRPWQFTQHNPPDAALHEQYQQVLAARRISYDDGLNIQNSNVSNLDGFAAYTESNAKRMGDSVDNLTGVLDYKWAGSSASGATWRVRSHIDGSNVFTATASGNSPNPRPAVTTAAGNLTIASLNTLNFFTTLDQSGAQTAAGHDPRGANSAEEFNRQLAKTVNALAALDADIVGLIEIENDFDANNDGSTAIEVLVNALNQQLGDSIYDYVYPGQRFVGTDAIAVAMIYKIEQVAVAEDSVVALLNDSVASSLPIFSTRDFNTDPIFDGNASNRVPMAVSFTHLASGDEITVVVNHFKSKGPSSLTDPNNPNFDRMDGAGYWNQRRLDAATAINAWLDTEPTFVNDDDVVILGDLNAYAMEEPVQYLLANGFNNIEDENAYSFVFDGQRGTLDYILVSDSLWQKFTEASVWHINSDEADALDYNLDFGRDPGYFDGATATRNADHDPLIAGFNLVPSATASELLAVFKQSVSQGDIRGAGHFPIVQHLHLSRFYQLLIKLQHQYREGNGALSCRLLHKLQLLSDGWNRPRDLIAGPGVVGFNQLLAQTMQELSCQPRRH